MSERRRGAPGSVVALVSSVGGLEALREALRGLPTGFPDALVALQHLDPQRRSSLPELLARDVSLPVAPARDGAALAPGTVAVAPAGWHTLIAAGPQAALIPSGSIPPARPSADLLLTSLAVTVGVAATAVVLSGGGHDGVNGASAVKRLGGWVVACDAATSTDFGMPGAAIDRQVVGAVLPLGEIAAALTRSTGAGSGAPR